MDEKLSKVLKRLHRNVELDLPLAVAERVRRLRWSMGELEKNAQRKGMSFDYELHIEHTKENSKMKGVNIVAFPRGIGVEEALATRPFRMVQISVGSDDDRDVMAMLFRFEEQETFSEFHYFIEDMANRVLTDKDRVMDLAYSVTRHDMSELPQKVLIFLLEPLMPPE